MTRTTAQFIGRAAQRGQCGKCGRELGTTYALVIDGAEVTYGRRCAARAMGWATTRVEMEAKRAYRIAETTRRREIVLAAFPALAPVWEAHLADNADRRAAGLCPRIGDDYRIPVIQDAYCSDHLWSGRGMTWQEYIESQLGL